MAFLTEEELAELERQRQEEIEKAEAFLERSSRPTLLYVIREFLEAAPELRERLPEMLDAVHACPEQLGLPEPPHFSETSEEDVRAALESVLESIRPGDYPPEQAEDILHSEFVEVFLAYAERRYDRLQRIIADDIARKYGY